VTDQLPTVHLDTDPRGLVYGMSQVGLLRMGATALMSDHEATAAGVTGREPMQVHVEGFGDQVFWIRPDRVADGWLVRGW